MATKKNTVTYLGTGRRKTSVARVFMTPGKGKHRCKWKNAGRILTIGNIAYGRSFTVRIDRNIRSI